MLACASACAGAIVGAEELANRFLEYKQALDIDEVYIRLRYEGP